MNWDAISAISQLIGSVAVVLSVLYLALQVHRSTRVARLATQDAAATALRDVTKPFMENADLERIWRVGLEDIAALWEGCGLTELRTAVLELSLEFPSAEDLWLPFLGGSTGFSAFARDLNRETGGAVAKRLREMIEAEYGTSEFMLTARAWAVAGRAAT